MKAKTPEAQLQLLVPTTINADGVEVGVLNTQYEPCRSRRARLREDKITTRRGARGGQAPLLYVELQRPPVMSTSKL